jgi:ubiquinone/menaquinone biosynthesis C-methylase UbiE
MQHPLIARLYDLALYPAERLGGRRLRRRLVDGLRGNVVEVAVGTGLNLPFYVGPESVCGVDPDPHMLERATSRASRADVPIRLVRGDAHHLPFADGTFDAAVLGFALCTIPDPVRALEEAHRVVRRDGVLRFLEHVRSPHERTAAWQDRAAPVWYRFAGGCRLNQPTGEILESTRWETQTLWRSGGGLVIAGEARRA